MVLARAVPAEGPVAVPPEVVEERHHEGDRGRGDVVQAERLVREREHAQVHDVAGPADRAELEELHPVVWAPYAVAHARVEAHRRVHTLCCGDARGGGGHARRSLCCRRLFGHGGQEGSEKW